VPTINLQQAIKEGHRIIPRNLGLRAVVKLMQNGFRGMKYTACTPFSSLLKDPRSPGIHCNRMMTDGPNESSFLPRTMAKPNILLAWFIGWWKETVPFHWDGSGKLFVVIQ
jgi:hypothetical protein